MKHEKRLTYKQWLKLRKHTKKHHVKHISWMAKERKKYSQFVYKHRRGIATTKKVGGAIGRGAKYAGIGIYRGSKATYGFARKEAPIISAATKTAAKRFGGFVGRELVVYKNWRARRQLARRGIRTYK